MHVIVILLLRVLGLPVQVTAWKCLCLRNDLIYVDWHGAFKRRSMHGDWSVDAKQGKTNVQTKAQAVASMSSQLHTYYVQIVHYYLNY